jgi:DNA helicase HerA-like ATPase
MRRNDFIPPFILFLEEAHNYCPENVAAEKAMAKSIIETIAREGRKFYAQLVLITQRPVRLSTTVLSQCNSQIIMRVTNPNDINHIKASSEHLTDIVNKINILPTGHALIVGAAVNYPVFVKIKQRTCINTSGERSLKDICLSYESKVEFIKGWNDFEVIKPEKIIGTQEGFIENDETNVEPFDYIDNHKDPVED